MKARAIHLHHVRVPFRMTFRHAKAERTSSENVVVAVDLVSGERGLGESVPREYVTGETVASALEALKQAASSVLHKTFISPATLIEFLDPSPAEAGQERPGDFAQGRPEHVEGRLRVEGNAARCALELALLDAAGKHFHKTAAELLGEKGVRTLFSGEKGVGYLLCEAPAGPFRKKSSDPFFPPYSGVISAEAIGAATWSAIKMRLFGFPHIKAKVGLSDAGDIELVRRLRLVLGPHKDLRLDANGVWNLDQAATMIEALSPYRISAVEQPLPKAETARMVELRQRVKVPLMLDESLCTLEDARQAAEEGWCDLFNIRISKCGGLLPSLRIAQIAREKKLGFQIGCQVGETGILSAAGRQLATLLPDARYLEGSYDRFLLEMNLTTRPVSFGYGGRARPLAGPGLGVEVSETALNHMTVSRVDINA